MYRRTSNTGGHNMNDNNLNDEQFIKFIKDNQPLPPEPSPYEMSKIKTAINNMESRKRGIYWLKWVLSGGASLAVLGFMLWNFTIQNNLTNGTLVAQVDEFLLDTVGDTIQNEYGVYNHDQNDYFGLVDEISLDD